MFNWSSILKAVVDGALVGGLSVKWDTWSLQISTVLFNYPKHWECSYLSCYSKDSVLCLSVSLSHLSLHIF